MSWEGLFGIEYTQRNMGQSGKYLEKYGITRLEMNKEFLDMDKSIRICEVGCNVGGQLKLLHEMGFSHLYGIDVSTYALENKYAGLNLIYGIAEDIPFKNNYFDLVFTSGLLIHISPDNLSRVMEEIYRCSSRFIWGFEYYDEQYRKITYREDVGLWKCNFAQLYCALFPDLVLVKEKRYKYLDSDNVDSMFLLRK